VSSVNYATFLVSKKISAPEVGFEAVHEDLNPALFHFQRDIVAWALRRGRAAIFADTGLGKTLMQLEWARHVYERTGRDVLIFVPLAVAQQTATEGEKFGIGVRICRDASDVRAGVNITNYERLHHFRNTSFAGIVLDESSILKGFDGKTRRELTAFGCNIPFRLCCTATPAPNDTDELANHAEFLGVMTGKEMLALFFRQDGNTTHKWRLKGHAHKEFWRWVSSWAMAVRSPADLGYLEEAERFLLPPLNSYQVTVGVESTEEGRLFGVEAQTLTERRQARRESLVERVAKAAEIVNSQQGEPFVVWCDLNAESEALRRAIPGSLEIQGSDTPEDKEKRLRAFSEGRCRVLITKPSIAGFGLNWQHCARMVFVSLSDSFERLFQATRRCWRFGQKRPVEVYIVTAEREGAVVENIRRKERQAKEMVEELAKHAVGNAARASGRESA
jgi:superfamily II DNA or RNA helicase